MPTVHVFHKATRNSGGISDSPSMRARTKSGKHGPEAEKLDPNIRCPLYPRKRTSSDTSGMSALCQKRTFELQQISYSMISVARARSAGGTVIFRPPRLW
jgi:hypothetical protein